MYLQINKRAITVPIPVPLWSKPYVCRGLLAGIAGSNTARARKSASCECCVLSGTGLYGGPIPRPEGSYRVCRCNNNSLRLLQWVGRGGQAKKGKYNRVNKSLVFCVKPKWSLSYKNIITLFIIALSNYTHTAYFFRGGVAITVSQSVNRPRIHSCMFQQLVNK